MMRILFFLCLVQGAFGSLDQTVHSLIQNTAPDLNVGISLYSFHHKKFIYEKNTHRAFVPASVQKILTVAGALSGPKKGFETKLYYSPREKVSYLVFGGDPLLSIKDLRRLLKQAKEKGLLGRRIHVVLKEPLLPKASPGTPLNALEYCNGASVYGATLSQNRALFSLKSDRKKASIIFKKGQQSFKVHNRSHVRPRCFKSDKVGYWDQVQRNALDFDGTTIHLKGCVPEKFEIPLCLPLKSKHLERHIQFLIHSLTKHRDIIFIKHLPRRKLTLVASHKRSFSDVLKATMKDSNNLAATVLFEDVSKDPKTPNNWDFAAATLKKKLEALLDNPFPDQVLIGDGSGLSLHNRLTPDFTTRLLAHIYNRWGEKFLKLMAQGGTGTLEKRFQDLTLFAKTGTLSGIRTLAGYFVKNRKLYAFSIFLNGTPGQEKPYKKLMTDLVYLLESYSP